MLDLKSEIIQQYPQYENKPGANLFFKLLQNLSHEDDINHFIANNQHLRGFDFLDKILEYFNFDYLVSRQSFNNIPAEGRLIIIANHPIGSLDGLALLKLIRSVRADVKIVANPLLSRIKSLNSLFLSVDNLASDNSLKIQYQAMLDALHQEQALIIFPAGEVSRIRPDGIKDTQWKKGFLKLAKKTSAPILPIYINGKNSWAFYSMSTIYKPLGTLMLVREMFNKQNVKITFHVSKPIAYKSLDTSNINSKKLVKLFKKHLYQLGKKKPKKSYFTTFETVIHPTDKRLIKQGLEGATILGETHDGKIIYLYEYQHDSAVMREIGRLRELTFRSVEEGTGNPMDIDYYDSFYKHLILWDKDDMEIVGSYRLAQCGEVIQKKSIDELYISSLFNLDQKMQPILKDAIELGRSFVQPRYWGKRSLDYLWFGIGAYLRQHPQIRYLLGPVSLSNAYPQQAKQLILSFYKQQFGSWEHLAKAQRPFEFSSQYDGEFSGDYKAMFAKLNNQLVQLHVKVPILYKQYSELCEDKGCHFVDYNRDPQFADCLDSLIIVELDKVKAKFIKRYIN